MSRKVGTEWAVPSKSLRTRYSFKEPQVAISGGRRESAAGRLFVTLLKVIRSHWSGRKASGAGGNQPIIKGDQRTAAQITSHQRQEVSAASRLLIGYRGVELWSVRRAFERISLFALTRCPSQEEETRDAQVDCSPPTVCLLMRRCATRSRVRPHRGCIVTRLLLNRLHRAIGSRNEAAATHRSTLPGTVSRAVDSITDAYRVAAEESLRCLIIPHPR
jgi:hypothetical protein